MKIAKKTKILMPWLQLFFRPKMKYSAQQSSVNEGVSCYYYIFFKYIFTRGRESNGNREALPESLSV